MKMERLFADEERMLKFLVRQTAASDSERARHTGTHVSECLNRIAERTGYYPSAQRDDDMGWGPSLMWELGWAWESIVGKEVLGRSQPEYVISVGTVERDGILGTPDGYDPETGTVHELKASWRSSTKWPLEQNWRYQAQAMSYCHMLDVNQAIIKVLYVCGNWKPPKPDVQMMLFEWTDDELEANWRAVLRERDMLTEERNRDRDL